MSLQSLKNHLKERHLDLNKSRVWLDGAENVATFPLWNLSGEMVGYQQYRPDGDKKSRKDPRMGKYFTFVSKEATGDAKLAVWGLEELNPRNKTVFLLEGVFKACRLHNHNLNALATLGNNPKNLTEWLRSFGFKTVSVCDGDTAGKKLGKFADQSVYLDDGVYVDEMTESELETLVHFG